MNEVTGNLEGRCLCGDVRVRISGNYDPRPGVCHCRMCQRWSGGVFLCFTAAEDAVIVEGPVTRFASSAFAERAFCATCGSHLWMRDLKGEKRGYDFMPGLFDDARNWPLRSEIYTDCAMASIRLKGDHNRASQAEYEASHPHCKKD